jgi:septum formation protein
VSRAPRLVLASTSRYRAELLARLDLPFATAAPSFEENLAERTAAGESPEAITLALARGKVESVRTAHPAAWILAADQIGVLAEPSGRPLMLGKAGSARAAVEQLMSLAGRSHELFTGVVLAPPGGGNPLETVDRQRLTMRAFSRREAERYVDRYRPFDCAGSYRIEDAGIALFERLEVTDCTGIIGLPLIAVARLLRKAGFLSS